MGFISFPLLLIIIYLFISIRVLKQYERGVVFLLGKFTGVRGPGLTLIFAPFQTMTRVSLRTVTMQIPSRRRRSSPRTMSRSISRRSPIITSPVRKGPSS